MFKIYFCIFMVFTLGGCFAKKPFQPPPPMFVSYVKNGASEQDVKDAMLQCGYSNVLGENSGDGNNLIADRQKCMFKKGFKFRDGYKGICSLKGKENFPNCKGG